MFKLRLFVLLGSLLFAASGCGGNDDGGGDGSGTGGQDADINRICDKMTECEPDVTRKTCDIAVSTWIEEDGISDEILGQCADCITDASCQDAIGSGCSSFCSY